MGRGRDGGVGFGAIALLGATMMSGADLVLDMVRFPDRVQRACLVITGEGSLDEQSLHGKAPMRVAAAAAAAGVRTVAVAGRCTIPPEVLATAGIAAAYALESLESDLATSIAQAGPLLERLGAQLALAELGTAAG
jgi:glycerate kinase